MDFFWRQLPTSSTTCKSLEAFKFAHAHVRYEFLARMGDYSLSKEPCILSKKSPAFLSSKKAWYSIEVIGPYGLCKEPFLASKEPFLVSKEPFLASKEPFLVSKEPFLVSKEPFLVSKEPFLVSKEPFLASKEPFLVSNKVFPPVKTSLSSVENALRQKGDVAVPTFMIRCDLNRCDLM